MCLLSHRIDDVYLRGDRAARHHPGLAGDSERIVGVIGGEHMWGVQCKLLCGVPDPVVGAGRAEVVTGGRSSRVLRVDDREERLAGAVHHVDIESTLENHHAGPVGQRPDEFDCSVLRSSALATVAAEYTSTLLRTSVASG